MWPKRMGLIIRCLELSGVVRLTNLIRMRLTCGALAEQSGMIDHFS
jgi:hypothetical protein